MSFRVAEIDEEFSRASSRLPNSARAESLRQSIVDDLEDGGPATGSSSVLSEEFPALEAIQYIVKLTRPASEVDALSKILLEEFGSVGAVLAGAKARFLRCATDASDLFETCKSLNRLISLSLCEPVRRLPITSCADLEGYLRFTLAHEPEEIVRALFLDAKNCLIKDEVHARGVPNSVEVYPRKLLERTFELGASGLILVHNHPGGSPEPSVRDVEFVVTLKSVLEELHIVFHDSVIVGRSSCFSMREAGYLGRMK